MFRADAHESVSSAPGFPVSIKGVLREGEAVLLRNEREEWELPGGELETGETPETCLRREILEELNLRVEICPVLDAWVYRISGSGDVFVVTYGCTTDDFTPLKQSIELSAGATFEVDGLESTCIPNGYRRAFRTWRAQMMGCRS